MNRSTTIAFALVIIPFLLLSQSKKLGMFPINNFGKEVAGIGSQNWHIKLLKNGALLFANNGGVLKYDGVHWDIFPLPNKTIVRSLCVVDERLIFAGGQDEVGFFDENFTFHSIREKIPSAHLPLEDVWEMLEMDGAIYFRSVNKVFKYDIATEKVEVEGTGSPIISIIKHKGNLYYHDLYAGLRKFSQQSKILPGSSKLKFIQLLDIISFSEKTLGITESHGLYEFKNGNVVPWNVSLNKKLVSSKLFKASVRSEGSLYLGTQFNGIIAVDTSGNIVESYSKSEGLINNSIHSMALDDGGNLWAGTSNGITKVGINSVVTSLQPDVEGSSSYYDVQEYNGDMYYASNTGLYKESAGTFSRIKNTEGQVWALDTLDGHLLAGHNRGPFIIKQEHGELLSGIPGAWKFMESGIKDHIYVGTYAGIDVYKKAGDRYSFLKKISGFTESSRILASLRPYEIWVSHPYRGIFRILHDSEFTMTEVKKYGVEKGLPSDLLNYIFNVNGSLLVTAEKGIYLYDREKDRFVLDQKMNAIIDSTQNVRRLFQTPDDKVWFVAEKEVGVLRGSSDGGYEKKVYPQLVGKLVGGFENMNFTSSNLNYVCTDEEILVLDESKSRSTAPPKVNFHEIRLLEDADSLITNMEVELAYFQNALRFTYGSPEHSAGVMYKYDLVRNESRKSSTWTRETQKDYNNLPPGEYAFEVVGKNMEGTESKPIRFLFEISPPWYLSVYAKACYALLLLGVLLSLFLIPRSKYKKDKEVLIEAKNQSEQELEKVKSEKLEAELASSTLHLVQKNEALHKIKAELEQFRDKLRDTALRKDLKKVISVVNEDARLEEDWESFSAHFDQVHKNFLSRISEEFPQITPKDRKLCAYLRMNLTTKEIAPLMHISVRGVEISRYRLRKKLNLPSDVNLNEFMMKY